MKKKVDWERVVALVMHAQGHRRLEFKAADMASLVETFPDGVTVTREEKADRMTFILTSTREAKARAERKK